MKYAPNPTPTTIPAFLVRCVNFLGDGGVLWSGGEAGEVELKRG